ncbi:MAG: GntR family transcriptional regulator [Armatimonadota bacterium]
MALLTKSQQVEHYLRHAIAGGRWAVGDALPSERELLAEFGISRTTLRDALGRLANEGIITRKSGSGTHVADVPKANSVAIVCTSQSLSSPLGHFYRRLAEAARNEIEQAGRRAVLMVGQGDTTEDFFSSINLFDAPVARDMIGALCLTTRGEYAEAMFSEAGMNVVSMGMGVPASKYGIVLDYAQMMRLAKEALHVYGHDDFVLMVREFYKHEEELPRVKKVKSLQLEAVGGRQERIIHVKPSLTYADAYRAFKEWWATPDHPNAIFFDDDGLCDVASRVILELGIKVPEQLAIITDLNVGRTIDFPVPLTGVGWDPAVLMREAWSMLNSLICGITIEHPVLYIPPVIIEGRSLGEPDNDHMLPQSKASATIV